MDDWGLVQAQVQGIQDWIASGATEFAVLSGGSLLLQDAVDAAVDRVLRWLAAAGGQELAPSQLADDGPPRDGFWFPVIACATTRRCDDRLAAGMRAAAFAGETADGPAHRRALSSPRPPHRRGLGGGSRQDRRACRRGPHHRQSPPGGG